MELFNLPHTTKVSRVIPKNAFDGYSSSKQKKLFTDQVARITWLHKLSPDTVNLEAREVKEIQIFKVDLKVKEDVRAVLELIDRSIPYHIIFIVEYNHELFLSTSVKHPHPTNQDNAVVDWTFRTPWFILKDSSYALVLKNSLDAVYQDFCAQISKRPDLINGTLHELVQNRRQVDMLEKEIEQLHKSIKNSKQYKNKVELNLLLKQKKQELKQLIRPFDDDPS